MLNPPSSRPFGRSNLHGIASGLALGSFVRFWLSLLRLLD
jgi:hypothetical protein